jgi:hypothetical protein
MVANLLPTIRIEAFKMARSARYADWKAIQTALEERGEARAGEALRDHTTRSSLDRRCGEARTVAT